MLEPCKKCSNQAQPLQLTKNPSKLLVAVNLLDQSKLDVYIEGKNTVKELFDKICTQLDIKEFDIFGLAQRTKNEYHFLSSNEKLNKYINSGFKRNSDLTSSSSSLTNSSINSTDSNSHTTSQSSFILNQSTNLNNLAHRIMGNIHNLSNKLTINSSNSYSFKTSTFNSKKDLGLVAKYQTLSHDFNNNKPTIECRCNSAVLTLYFRVKFYVSEMLLLRDTFTRYLYYLQLRQNYLMVNHKISEEKYFVLATLAIVADFGAFNKTKHIDEYFNINLYFPAWIINKLGSKYIYQNIPALHEQHSHLTSSNAQSKFCTELSNDEYPYNLHFYWVFKTKDEITTSLVLGIAPKGILVFDSRNFDEISLISTFSWSTVSKINSDKKKFEVTINADTKLIRYAYFTVCERVSKYLLELSKSTHSFTVNVFERLADQKTLANYMNESYNEKIDSLNNGPSEQFQEREITGQIYEETGKDIKQLTEDLSSCSVSSSSSSCCEVALGSAHVDVPNLTENLSILNEDSFTKDSETKTLKQEATEYENLSMLDNNKTSNNISADMLVDIQPSYNSFQFNITAEAFSDLKDQFMFNNHPVKNDLTYRQTFSAVSRAEITSNKRSKLRSKRSYLPQSPGIKNTQYPLNSHFLQNSQNSDISLNDSNNQSNVFKSGSFVSGSDSSSNYESIYGGSRDETSSPSFTNPPYIKYKKPPTYQESLKKIRKYSNYERTGNDSSNQTLNRVDMNDLEMNTKLYLKINSADSSENETDSLKSADNNKVSLSIENLEQIRMKAASMSLPLLTALCSDKDLIRSINNSSKEESFL